VSEVAVASLVCLCVLAGAALGASLRSVLPEHHMSEQSRQIVNIAIGLIATLAALVLGLLVASAKSSFEQRND
jgi:fluoride ion exporter CrcB/FEX